MSGAETETSANNARVLADLDDVMRRIIDGTPVVAERSRRIEERADRITEEIRHTRGAIKGVRHTRGAIHDHRFHRLLHDDDGV
jgi:hypothetical protein